jgi:hypothetical protein
LIEYSIKIERKLSKKQKSDRIHIAAACFLAYRKLAGQEPKKVKPCLLKPADSLLTNIFSQGLLKSVDIRSYFD